MARRARKPLLPQLIWGRPKRTYKQGGQVSVRRVPIQTITVAPRLAEDFFLAAGIRLGLVAFIVVGA